MRKWTPPVLVEDHLERRVVYADGRVTRDVDVTLTEEQFREMATGYRCVRCLAQVESAFPETCGFPGCDGYPDGFPMRERQQEVLEREFDGYKWIGVSRETWEKWQNEDDKATSKRSSGIWVPGDNQ